MNRSRERGEDFQFLLQRYAAERFLYRLGASPHRQRLVLKGGMLHAVWGGSAYRPTRDIDFTGYLDPAPEAVLAVFREILAAPAAEDGLAFDAGALTTEPIREEVEYGGLRVRFPAALGTARIAMQVDVGFGDAIAPGPLEVEYPALLDAPAPHIRSYPPEAVVAEKLHALVVLGERNSRYKDFYDLYVLSERFEFEGEKLAAAVRATFERRRTGLQEGTPAALKSSFYASSQRAESWAAFLRKTRAAGAAASFHLVGERLDAFLAPAWRSLAQATPRIGHWSSKEGWR
jgi:predicted nucleotidyltransferase component of viral defense system